MAENRHKEVATFVERVTRRLIEDPKAPLSGRHRLAFIAVRDLVDAALETGCTMKATWETLREDGKLSMTYETFRGHCREFGLGRRRRAMSAKSAAPGDAARAAPARTEAPAHAAGRQIAPPAGGPREFRHDPVPRLDKIYG